MLHLARNQQQLGAIIRRVRRSSKLSQKALGEKAHLWQETISRIENGASGTKLETLFDILASLNLELIIAPRRKGKQSDIEEIF